MMKIPVTTIAVMFLWAICYPLISLSLPFAPPMLTAFFRATIAGFLLIAIASILKRPIPKTAENWVYIIAIGLTATGVGFWGMFYAGSLLSPGLATVLTNTQPLIASLLGWYFLKERPEKLSMIAIGLGFSGIFVISTESFAVQNSQSLNGIFYISIAAVGIAVSNILLKRFAGRADILFTMGFQFLIGAIPIGLLSLSRNEFQLLQWTYSYAWVLFVLAIFGTALPYILWFWLMDNAPLYKLNVFSFLTPVFGLYMGVVYFSEALTIFQWSGVIIIGFAIVLVARSNASSTHQMGL